MASSGGQVLAVRRDSGIVTALVNRPEKLNALSKGFFEELGGLVTVLATDRTVRCLIISGIGDKAFSVGADLKERQGMTEKDAVQRGSFVRGVYLQMERLSFPVIAAINGTALGSGLELALACDLRVAAANATLGFPEVELGIIPGNGGTQRLPRIVGTEKALELVLLAKRLSAEEALKINLVHAVVPAGQAMAQAKIWATKMAEAGPLALKQAKAAIRGGMEKTLEDGLTWEIECYRPLLGTKDRLEGLKAFMEKRKPLYKGE